MTVELTPPDLDRITVLLGGLLGLRAEPSMRSRLRRCVLDAAADRTMTARQYVDTLAGDRVAVQDLFDRVTVQETGFFRHPEQFGALVDRVLPTIPGAVRIWCAASANGQEPYSLAMVLAEQGRAGHVLATDVSTGAVNRTAAGRYTGREIRGLSPQRQAAHLSAAGRGWQVTEAVRKKVVVHQHNLLDPIPAEAARCQVVFCRNVLIYFTPEHARAFLTSLADVVPAGTYLFVGSAETIWHITDRFEAVALDDAFVYRSRAQKSTAPPPPRPAGPPPAVEPVRRARPARAATAPEPAAGAGSPAPAEAGLHALRAGDPAGAVIAFRRWAYTEPDNPQAHLHLGLALESAGDHQAARRAFRSARAALDHADPSLLGATTGSYQVAELHRFLTEKGQAIAP